LLGADLVVKKAAPPAVERVLLVLACVTNPRLSGSSGSPSSLLSQTVLKRTCAPCERGLTSATRGRAHTRSKHPGIAGLELRIFMCPLDRLRPLSLSPPARPQPAPRRLREGRPSSGASRAGRSRV
jgi:hypothetical protein